MQLVSAIPGTRMVKVQGRAPWQAGPQEIVFPARQVAMKCGVPLKLREELAETVLKRHGPAGVEAVEDGASAEVIHEALLRAKRKRYHHLSQVINGFRAEQAMRQAANVAIQMPTESHRAILRELRTLKQEVLESDPVMTEQLPEIKGFERIVPEDPLAEELTEFGIGRRAAPLMPGVEPDADVPL